MTFQDIELKDPIHDTKFKVQGKVYTLGSLLAGAQYSRIKKLKRITFANNPNVFIIAMDEDYKWKFIMNVNPGNVAPLIVSDSHRVSEMKAAWTLSFNTLKEVKDWLLVHLL